MEKGQRPTRKQDHGFCSGSGTRTSGYHTSVERDSDPDSHLLATSTRLGWLIYGAGGNSGFVGLNLRVCHASVDNEGEEELNELVRRFYEWILSVSVQKLRLGREDERALRLLKERTQRVGDHYETGLLWRDTPRDLPDSRDMCLKRMANLHHRMMKDTSMAHKLEEIIDDHLRKGYCRDVTGVLPREPTWYLPIFPVTNPE